MEILEIQISKLSQDPSNARKHSDKNLDAIKGSLAKFGQQKPIVIDQKNIIIAGNGTYQAAKALGWETLQCVKTHLTGTELAAYGIADNRSGELAEWDIDALKKTLEALNLDNFDLNAIGFDDDDLKKMLGDQNEGTEGLTDPDEVPENVETRCKPGDMWQLGEHRLLCGDSTNVQHVERLMGGEKADMVFTDPPYGMSVVRKDGNNNGLGESINGVVGIVGVAARGKYKPVIGDDTTKTAIDAYNLCCGLQISTMFFWGANFYAEALDPSSGWVVWDKENGEGFFADGELAWTNSPKQLRIFRHQWNGMIRKSERGEKRVHPTQKPIALAEWCFENYGDPKIVIDIFLGSGSTLIACEKTGRKCYGMEIDPHYCDVILKRWEQFTGKEAKLVSAENTVNG
jgi:16S rRNA G966 N2-methylase RsmD